MRGHARRGNQRAKHALLLILETERKGSITAELFKGDVKRQDFRDARHDVVVRVAERIEQLRATRAYFKWESRIINEVARSTAAAIDFLLSCQKQHSRSSTDKLNLWGLWMKNSIDIRLVLSQLTPEQRAAVVLHYYEGLTYESVASRLGWKRWKVKKRIYAARCIMRKVTGLPLGRGVCHR